ncbi:MAG TPA: hypothetical protein VFH73_02590 [Polyangia bacterium]|nr:hypothetical protein [Polyangia bacterium]
MLRSAPSISLSIHAAIAGLLLLVIDGCVSATSSPGLSVDAGQERPLLSVDAGQERPLTSSGGANTGGVGGQGTDASPAVTTDDGGVTQAEAGAIDTGSVPNSDASSRAPTDAGSAAGPFSCSEMIGLWVMSQWWGSFEKGVNNTAWQYTFVHHGYLEAWADPTSAFWTTKVISPCPAGADHPDRLIFLPFSLTLKTLDEWQRNLSKVVDVIKTKFAGVRRIEFITTIRSPQNQLCPNDNDPNIVVPAYVDDAIKNVVDMSDGLVTIGPKIEVADCKWWVGGTDLTGEGNAGVGQRYGEYYKAHP